MSGLVLAYTVGLGALLFCAIAAAVLIYAASHLDSPETGTSGHASH